MLKLKLQYFGHLIQRTDSFEKTLTLRKIEGRRKGLQGWDGCMASLTQWTWVWVNSASWWWIGRPGMLQSMGLQRVRHNWATELNWYIYIHTHTHTHTSYYHYCPHKMTCLPLWVKLSPSEAVCWSPNHAHSHLRIWLYLEIESLQM